MGSKQQAIDQIEQRWQSVSILESFKRSKAFIVATAILTVIFSIQLIDLAKLSLSSTLYSHIILLPVVALYLAWLEQSDQLIDSKPNRFLGLFFALCGVAILAWQFLYGGLREAVSIEGENDRLAYFILSYVLLIISSALFLLDWNRFKTHMFSFGILLFIVPFPSVAKTGIESFLQYTSAEAAYQLFALSGTPVLRHSDLIFELPNIKLEVAPQCSGIRSSLVLLIVSIVAAKLFLTKTWKRWLLVLFVIPLAIIRNGVRVFTIGQLCTIKGPHMIDSWIHKSGGPLFFALSLIPFFILLLVLWKSENRGNKVQRIPESQTII